MTRRLRSLLKRRLSPTGRAALLVGIGLAGVFALSSGQEIVKAFEMGSRQAVSIVVQQSAPVQMAPVTVQQAPAPQMQPTAAPQIASALRQSQVAASPQSATAHPAAPTALEEPKDTARVASAAQQQVAAQQLAAAGWRGASFPVENFQSYTSPFGYRQSPDGSPNQEFHRGLDIAAPQGSYIRNWWTGQVTEVSDGTACGTYIRIQSGEWEHLYCHMEGQVETFNGQRYLVDREGGIQIPEGQVIPAGSRIGRVGMTGRTTGPHLHWGLKYTGQWVDPALVLRAMYAEQSNPTVVRR